MAKTKRQFTPEEKYSILQEAEREGVTETARKYNLAHSVLNYWKRKYLVKGKDGLKPGYKKVDPLVRSLEEENARLKKIIANQALELEFKTELLKKSDAHYRKAGK
ncbi:transposase [Flavihumibacter rivuli]|uniref:transposase n=1 Tax=Flavihumibacter rivuli TaxID=2838156 RepID=UPI001BDDEC3A|nr:transposase [Flavihumibacter rivuli]ULQ55068.1 transposase [Flavihumibacter rivuli]ULQ55977.1 transposase [Flavihumibacter rivuli]ULQ57147.1 transposase [Flavihumibacter rivuli]